MFGSNKNLPASLLVAMLFAAEFTSAQSQYQFQHFDTRDGLMDDFVWSIAQDSLGYMWFQYFAGLTRFDGYNFKVYKYDKDDSLRSSLDFLLGRIGVDPNKNMLVTKHGHPPDPPFTFARYDRKVDGFRKFTADLDLTTINKWRVDEPSGTIWLSMRDGSGLGAFDMKTKQITKYVNPSSYIETQMQQNTLFDSEDMGSSILVATENGLWSFDKATKTFSRPACPPRDSAFLYHTNFFHIGPKNQLWLGKPGAFVKLGADLSVEESLDLPPDFNMSGFAIDSYGVFWFGTWSQGLYRADPKDDVFVNIVNVPGDPYSLKSNKVYDVKVDRDQNIWIATGKGLSKISRRTMGAINLGHGLGDDATVGTYKTRNNEFIVTSKEISQNSWEILMGEVLPRQLSPIQFKKLTTINGILVSAFLQGRRYFWVSVAFKGLFGFPINSTTGLIDTSHPLVIRHDPGNPNTISHNAVGTMWEDDEENLWVSGSGLVKVNLSIPYGEKGSVTTYVHQESDTSSISSNVVYQIHPEDRTSFWVVTDKGVDLFRRQTGKFQNIFKDREGPSNVHKTSDGTLFLATLKGLYEAKKTTGGYQFDGPPIWDRSEVKGIQEDKLGRLWLRTSIGIICYDRKARTALEFNEGDGLLHYKHYQLGFLHQTFDGEIFTVDNGITLFDPVTLKIDSSKTYPVLTKLEVNNKTVLAKNHSVKENDFLIGRDISMLDELTIDYRHNNFTIEFSAMEMTAPEKNLYRHKLEGYDELWIETDYRNRTATYTNLDPGHYTFKVTASNHHGIWNDVETTLAVTVLPPPWKTAWAYAGYTMIFIGLLFAARKSIVQRERLKSNLKLAKVEQEKEHFELEKAIEVDKVKSTFFANISHEFRTPLTLIKGPVQNLLEQFSDHPNVKEQLKLVQRNSDLLLKLINQLLDLAKLESGNLAVEKSDNDLNSFLTAVINSFSSLAFQKNIALEMELPSTKNLARFDKDKVETILINLINNAIKFTPAGGTVKVTAALNISESPDLVLSVSDTGIGIPIDQQNKVFERFHQVSEAHKEVGTGIGLSLVKELVALMKGTLSLKSESGKGSEFTIILPMEVIRVLSETEQVQSNKEMTDLPEFVTQENGHETEETGKPRVLVVEDNGDLRRFIIDCLGNEFHFLEAADGKQGMEKAFEEVPDLIVSDVMMPEMDGITMTGKLKKDTRTSHIPLILLTAKTSDESKLSGLGTGADDYLTKPFNKNELLLKVRNSIALRVKLREKIRLELLKESPKVEVQSADEQFLWKVKEAILARLSDEQLSVESLAEEISLSRSQLLRKITALTGVSVNELIRTFRLQKAAQLLEQNWAPVTQVAYEVGFSNLSYFSKVFKEQYGVLPSEYATKVQ